MEEFKPTLMDWLTTTAFGLLIGFGTNSICLGFAGFMLGASLTTIVWNLQEIRKNK